MFCSCSYDYMNKSIFYTVTCQYYEIAYLSYNPFCMHPTVNYHHQRSCRHTITHQTDQISSQLIQRGKTGSENFHWHLRKVICKLFPVSYKTKKSYEMFLYQGLKRIKITFSVCQSSCKINSARTRTTPGWRFLLANVSLTVYLRLRVILFYVDLYYAKLN